jgi:hypothetical protein
MHNSEELQRRNHPIVKKFFTTDALRLSGSFCSYPAFSETLRKLPGQSPEDLPGLELANRLGRTAVNYHLTITALDC